MSRITPVYEILPARTARLRAAVGALALCLAAACADDTATGPVLQPPAAGTALALACRAEVRTGTVECAAPAPAVGGGSAAILGGQGINVRLRSSGVSYDGTSTFRMDVTVENLTGQVLGTADGVTPAPEGVRVFFASGPTSTTGEVEVANATGEAFFTAAGQKYFQYDGLLAPGDTTAPLEWRFTVPPTVESFQFVVYVAAAVARESGWLRVAPFLPAIAVGDSLPLTAHRYDVAGRPGATGTITWSSADSSIARVAADGTVTGVGPGNATVFATDGTRTSSVVVHVRGTAGDLVAPTAHEISVTPARVNADGADSVTISLRLTDGGTGARFFLARLTSPSGAHTTYCDVHAPATGTPADGTFTCKAPIPSHVEGGVWRMTFLWFEDWAENERTADADVLRNTGASVEVYVHSPTPDLAAPTLTDVAFAPDSIEANGVDSTTVELAVADAGSGVSVAEAWFRNPSGNDLEFCEARAPSEGTAASGTFRCRLAVQSGGQPGNWTLEIVRISDAAGNTREVGTAALDSAGYPTVLRVSGPPADTQPPTLTGFSFSPDSVTANGADSVTVTMEVTDAGSGAYRADVTFVSPSRQTVSCVGYTPVAPHAGSQVITCRLALASGRETGEWRIWFVSMDDAAGNAGFIQEAGMQALGYPTVLTVTP